MKKSIVQLSLLFAVCLSYLVPTQAFSQDAVVPAGKTGSHSFVKLARITKFYSKDELNKLPKLDLINIYKSRLTYLIEILPFISLHPEPGSTFHDMSIPETETNIGHLDTEAKNKQAFVKTLNEILDDVIPYSEKSNIVWSIMYFDEMIKKSYAVVPEKK
jgi:hypothetical protein